MGFWFLPSALISCNTWHMACRESRRSCVYNYSGILSTKEGGLKSTEDLENYYHFIIPDRNNFSMGYQTNGYCLVELEMSNWQSRSTSNRPRHCSDTCIFSQQRCRFRKIVVKRWCATQHNTKAAVVDMMWR